MTPIIFLGRTAELYTTEPFESARTWFCANGTYSRAVGYNPSAFRPSRWSRKCLCLNGRFDDADVCGFVSHDFSVRQPFWHPRCLGGMVTEPPGPRNQPKWSLFPSANFGEKHYGARSARSRK